MTMPERSEGVGHDNIWGRACQPEKSPNAKCLRQTYAGHRPGTQRKPKWEEQ